VGNDVHAIYYDMQAKTQLTMLDLLYDLGKKIILELEHSYTLDKKDLRRTEFL
jgi:hypothetical protein